jgi:anti-sigma B factor antagonist
MTAIHRLSDYTRPGRISTEFVTAGAAFRRTQYGPCTLIEGVGEIDVAAADLLRSVIVEAPTARLVVDLSQITAMDSIGVSVLVSAWRRAASTGGAVRLVRPYGSPLKVLQDTGVDRLLPILDDVETALRLDRAAADGIWEDSRHGGRSWTESDDLRR